MILRIYLLCASLAFAADAVGAQRPADVTAEPPIRSPAFLFETGPAVAIDEAHQNTHTLDGAFQQLGRLLSRDGFRVRAFAETISRETLNGIDVLVIAQPGGWEGPAASLNESEVAALLDWVRGGGSLLLILDHMPGPAGGQRLAAALGIEVWHNGYVAIETQEGPVYTIRFQPDGRQTGAGVFETFGGGVAWQGPDALLVEHAVMSGRDADERVESVLTFGGSAFRASPGLEPLLVLPGRAVSIVPTERDRNPSAPGAQRVSVNGWLAGAVMNLGRGRVALFAETGMFSAQWPVHEAAADNYKLVLNVIRWLGGLL